MRPPGWLELVCSFPYLQVGWHCRASNNIIGQQCWLTVRWWFVQSQNNPAVNLEAAILGSYSALSNLVFRGPKAQDTMTVPMRTTVRVWEQLTAKINLPQTFSPYTPFWGNPKLPHLLMIPDPAVWAKYEIKILQHIMPEGKLLSFDEM